MSTQAAIVEVGRNGNELKITARCENTALQYLAIYDALQQIIRNEQTQIPRLPLPEVMGYLRSQMGITSMDSAFIPTEEVQ